MTRRLDQGKRMMRRPPVLAIAVPLVFLETFLFSVPTVAQGAKAGQACREEVARILDEGGLAFEGSRVTLLPESQRRITRLATALASCPDTHFEIGGHTDGDGYASYNQRLSEARAARVLRALVAEGLDPWRFQARGYGETQPVASNRTAEGKRRNRRITFRVVGEPALVGWSLRGASNRAKQAGDVARRPKPRPSGDESATNDDGQGVSE